ncbi:hypothetical protein ABZT49_13045 [Methylobacterium sp. EM32]|uniref:hypothetical protein n=1 Tax=Methylobacterium sp. EM32 TaxID=3163481 RepID=UPI0033A654EE
MASATPPQPPTANSRDPTSAGDGSALAAIDRHIAVASPKEALAWTQIRDTILLQDEAAKDRDHIRRVELLGIYAKLGLSGAAIGSGVALAFGGFGLPAFLCLGAGLYGLAPDFIKVVTNRIAGDRSKGKLR